LKHSEIKNRELKNLDRRSQASAGYRRRHGGTASCGNDIIKKTTDPNRTSSRNDEQRAVFEGIDVFELNDQGKIQTMWGVLGSGSHDGAAPELILLSVSVADETSTQSGVSR
jgi:hypothetical protein